MDKPDLLTPAEVAELCNVTPATVRVWIRSGRIPGVRVGGRFRIHRLDLEKMLKPVEPAFVERPESAAEKLKRDAETESILREWGVIE